MMRQVGRAEVALGVLWATRAALAVFSTGFVHPDEWFQSVEVLMGGVRSWEFSSDAPIRSVVTPVVVCAVPLLGRLFGIELYGKQLFYSIRLTMLAYSFVLDYVLYRVCRATGRPPIPYLISFAMLWPVLVIQIRPFSNSVEAIYLGFALLEAIRGQSPALFGCACAAGIFSRITFPAFALPSGLYLLYRWRRSHANVAVAAFAFVTTVIVHVVADSLFFGTLTLEHGWQSSTLTILNNLKYNSKTENLAHHGLHPRWTHAVVNLPLLFGPAVLLGAGYAVRRRQKGGDALRTLALGTIVSGTIVLSIFPHQEPRFLLPLSVPVAILLGDFHASIGKYSKALIVIHTVILTVLFGVLHQSGIVRVLVDSGKWATWSQDNYNVSRPVLTFSRTYMPPTCLAAPFATVEDVRDMRIDEVFRHVPECGMLALPASVATPPATSYSLLGTYWGHLSTEDLPASARQVALNLYAKKCR
ncbi:Mannosyltransferase [Plasmodiophora brassicae]|nr:hypothetical protein PBRA_007992 [Plasmodiophora brassicae]